MARDIDLSITRLDHEVVANYAFLSGDPITIKEALVYKTLCVHLASSISSHDKRVVNGYDSMALKGSAAKGRSSSRRLNRVLRQALPHRVGARLQLGHFYIPSELNCPDDITRCVPLRRGLGVPAWAELVGPPPGLGLLEAALKDTSWAGRFGSLRSAVWA